MRQLSRVVWSEGMHLAQHHFQLQNRYFEDLIRFSAESLHSCPVGLAGISWNKEALANGLAALTHARGFLPDGTPFLIPESDSAPEPLEVRALLSPAAFSGTISLTLPAFQRGGANCLDENSRYSSAEESYVDEVTGIDERRVEHGQKNFRLMLEEQVTRELTALPIGRVVRNGVGGIEFDPEFVPPCISIAASPRLLLTIRRLTSLLEEKAAVLASERSPNSLGGSTQREVFSFWYLHCINSGLAELQHLLQIKNCHPVELFRAMLKLGGSLCTFVLEPDLNNPRIFAAPRDLPQYEHLKPEAGFSALEEHIKAALNLMLPAAAINIRLNVTSPNRRDGDIVDSRCLGRAQWVLGLRAKVPQSRLVSRTPLLVKVCASAFLEKLVERALPGMDLSYIPTPPAEIKRKPEMQYFAVSRVGPCWERIVQTKQVGIFVPGEFPDVEVELIAIPES